MCFQSLSSNWIKPSCALNVELELADVWSLGECSNLPVCSLEHPFASDNAMKCIGVKKELSREISNYTFHAHTHEQTLWRAANSDWRVSCNYCHLCRTSRVSIPVVGVCVCLVEPADTSLQDTTSHISQSDVHIIWGFDSTRISW